MLLYITSAYLSSCWYFCIMQNGVVFNFTSSELEYNILTITGHTFFYDADVVESFLIIGSFDPCSGSLHHHHAGKRKVVPRTLHCCAMICLSLSTTVQRVNEDIRFRLQASSAPEVTLAAFARAIHSRNQNKARVAFNKNKANVGDRQRD